MKDVPSPHRKHDPSPGRNAPPSGPPVDVQPGGIRPASSQHSGLEGEPIQAANEPTPITPERRIEGLRNLRKGYDLVAAVGFWIELHGEDLIEEYAGLVEQYQAAREALAHVIDEGIDRWHDSGDGDTAPDGSDVGLPEWLGMSDDEYRAFVEGGLDAYVAARASSPANDPDGPEAFAGTLMDGLEDEPPYPASEPEAS